MPVMIQKATSPLYRLTVAQFDRMAAAGIFPEGHHVELLAGRIYEVTKSEPHNFAVGVLSMLLRPLVPPGYHVREEKSARSGRTWKPEPDLGIARGTWADYVAQSPSLDRFALLIEVSESSYGLDAGPKLRKYAAVGVPVYWIVDLTRRRVEVHRNPAGRGKTASYKAVTFHDPGDSIPVEIDGREAGRLAVIDILPPEPARS